MLVMTKWTRNLNNSQKLLQADQVVYGTDVTRWVRLRSNE